MNSTQIIYDENNNPMFVILSIKEYERLKDIEEDSLVAEAIKNDTGERWTYEEIAKEVEEEEKNEKVTLTLIINDKMYSPYFVKTILKDNGVFKNKRYFGEEFIFETNKKDLYDLQMIITNILEENDIISYYFLKN